MDMRRRAVFIVAYNHYEETGEFKLPHGTQKQLAEDFDCHRNTIGNDLDYFKNQLKGALNNLVV
jgi:hypothetical protein